MRYFPVCLAKVVLMTAFGIWTSNVLGASETNDDTTAARITVRGTDVREFDWAKLQARARVAYLSSGPKTLSARMIDNDLQTVFRFSESDKSPTVIVELAKSTQLHRVSAVFRAEDARLDVFLLNELPKDIADLQFAKPDASVVSLPDERGTLTANFSVSSARYVALRWNRKRTQDPLTVAEISAFSNDPTDLISDQDTRLADNAKTFADPEPPLILPISQ
jgi:hypothetical protein